MSIINIIIFCFFGGVYCSLPVTAGEGLHLELLCTENSPLMQYFFKMKANDVPAISVIFTESRAAKAGSK
jgi:hypothetical protein